MKFFNLLWIAILFAAPMQASSKDFLLEEWKAFSQENPFLDCYTPHEIADRAISFQKKSAEKFSIKGGFREIDPQMVEKMLAFLKQSGPLKIFMRHGEQEKSKRVSLLAPALQKIEMMRLPDNREDDITTNSCIEWLGELVVLEYLHQMTRDHFFVETSANQRAYQPAAALAEVLQGDFSCSKALGCVNYPQEKEMSAEKILGILPDGALPWQREKVDQVIGAGIYDNIICDMESLICEDQCSGAVLVAITHTQQLNAIQHLMHLPLKRLGNFGFVVLGEHFVCQFPSGFFKE